MADTKREILAATRAALVEYGYRDLTTQKVAEELGKSHSLIHYHYDTKTDLLAAFVEFTRDQVEALLSTFEDRPPGERLAATVAFLAGNADDPEVRALNLAVYEMQADAYHHPALRDPLAVYDGMLVGFLADTIADGVEVGTFAAVDPQSTARLILSAVDGAILQQYTLDADAVETVAFRALPEYVFEDLYVGDPPDVRAVAEDLDLEAVRDRMDATDGGGGDG